MAEFDAFLSLLNELGTLGILAWLVWQGRRDLRLERVSHDDTRHLYREDLREIANIRKSLTPDS